jgi:phage baseplate assembly protein V
MSGADLATSQLWAALLRMVRTARITEVAPADGLVKVLFEDADTPSPWLPWASALAGPTEWVWAAPNVGARVLVFAPRGDTEDGVVFGQLPADAANAPADDDVRVVQIGAVRIEIDSVSGDVTISTPGALRVVDGSDSVQLSGGAVSATGNVNADGNVSASGEVSAGSLAFSTHIHQTAQGPTDPPSSPPAP